MAFELKKEKMQFSEKIAEAAAQQNIDFDVTLPDYCGDVKKILKCIVTPGIGGTTTSAAGVTVSGTVTVRLIYVSEKDKTDCYETTRDFSLEAKAKDIPATAVLTVSAKTNYTNCRATSQRKISISANIGISVVAERSCEKEILTDVCADTMQCRKRSVDFQQLLCQREKVFEIGETASLGEGKASIGKILRVNSYAVIDSKKAVSDKLLVKGEMYTEIFYIADGGTAEFERFKHSMPISQIIDMPGIDEKSECCADISVRQVLLSVKQDSSSSNRLIEIAAKLSANVKSTQKKSIQVIEDAYCISHETKSQYTIQEFLLPVYTVDRQKTHKTTLDLPSASIRQVVDIWCNETVCSIKGKDDKVDGMCSVSLGIVYLDDKGVACYTEKTAEFDVPMKLPQSYGFLKCSMSAHVRSIEFKLASKDKIDISIETGLLAQIFSSQSYRILNDIETGDKKEKSCDATLTLYFACAGEKMWDISKKYNTMLSLVMQENGIEGEEVESDCMLMIPSA